MATKAKGKKPPSKSKPKKKATAAKKPAEERYDTPEALARYDAAFFARSQELYAEVQSTRHELAAAEQRRKDIKKKHEAAVLAHQEHTVEGKKWRGQKPPGKQLTFDDVTPEAGAPATNPQDAGPGWYPADLWRQFPLERFAHYGATTADIKKLAEGRHKHNTSSTPITTVGELSDFTRPWANDPTRNSTYADIKGIGAEAATRISDAELRFWQEWKTLGLAAAFAQEQGFSPPSEIDGRTKDAPETSADAGSRKGTARKRGGKGDKPGQRRKVGSGGKKPVQKRTTPADQPAAPEDDQPATVPFFEPGQPYPVPDTDTDEEDARESAG